MLIFFSILYLQFYFLLLGNILLPKSAKEIYKMFTPIQKIKKLHDKHHDEDLGHCIYEDLVYDLHVVQAEVKVDEGFLVG